MSYFSLLGRTYLLTCLRVLRTSAFLCFETEKKKISIQYKTNSCMNCFTVYKRTLVCF